MQPLDGWSRNRVSPRRGGFSRRSFAMSRRSRSTRPFAGRPAPPVLKLEELESRAVPAAVASLVTAHLANGTLTVQGADGNDHIVVAQDKKGNLSVADVKETFAAKDV